MKLLAKKSLLIPAVIATLAAVGFYSISRHFVPKNAFDPFIIAKTMMQEPPEIPGPGDGPNVWGPFTGVVLDAETQKPIPKVQIYLFISVDDFKTLMFETGSYSHEVFTQTNSKGQYKFRQYRFPQQGVIPDDIRFRAYKAGYIGYNNKWIFKDGERKDFKIKNNIIMLEKWDDKNFTMHDRVENTDILGGALGCDRDLPGSIRFCLEARDEMILACMYKYTESEHPYVESRKNCEKFIDEKIYQK